MSAERDPEIIYKIQQFQSKSTEDQLEYYNNLNKETQILSKYLIKSNSCKCTVHDIESNTIELINLTPYARWFTESQKTNTISQLSRYYTNVRTPILVTVIDDGFKGLPPIPSSLPIIKPLGLYDKSEPNSTDTFWTYGKKVLKELKSKNYLFPTLFVSFLKEVRDYKGLNSNVILHIRTFLLKYSKIELDPNLLYHLFTEYYQILRRLKMNLKCYEKRSLYKLFMDSPALNLRGGKRSKLVKRKRKQNKKSKMINKH